MRIVHTWIPVLGALLATGAFAEPAAPAVAEPAAATPAATPVPTSDAPVASAPARVAAKPLEAIWSNELRTRAEPGTAVDLDVAGTPVLALYSEAIGEAKGAVILVHDQGAHADWPAVVGPLRRTLPRHGWAVLSVQMPVPNHSDPALGRTAFLDAADARIQAALTFLEQKNHRNVVLAGHGLGAIVALEFAATHADAVEGLVLAGVPHDPAADARLDAAKALAAIRLPVLDVYGTNDRAQVVATAEIRRNARYGDTHYRQIALPGADHAFNEQEAMLARRVAGWLAKVVEGRATVPPSDNVAAPPMASPPQEVTPPANP